MVAYYRTRIEIYKTKGNLHGSTSSSGQENQSTLTSREIKDKEFQGVLFFDLGKDLSAGTDGAMLEWKTKKSPHSQSYEKLNLENSSWEL